MAHLAQLSGDVELWRGPGSHATVASIWNAPLGGCVTFPALDGLGGCVEFRILGPLEILDEGGRPLPLGGAKQRALLAILLINANQVVSADRLIDDIWGEEAPATASNALQVYVSQLRKVLKVDANGDRSDLIVTRPPGYLIQIQMNDLDLGRFDDLVTRGREKLMSDEPAEASVLLRSALALWRGAALADFTYEPFAQTEIEKLEEMRILAFEDRIESDLALGKHAQAIPELEAAIASEPMRERLREHQMLALYRSGRQADSLQVYQEMMRALADQLGIDPSPTLQRLHEAILRQDPSLELPELDQPAQTPSDTHAELAAQTDELEVRQASPLEPAAGGGQVFPVTVLFADIVGSTSLGERLSPDEVRAVTGECVNRMSHAVEGMDGMIQAYMGDGICAYFGLPVSHEDDTERAARAALRIRRVVHEFAQELESAWDISGFAVRIGLNAGRSVVGLVGAGAPQEVAFGDAVNVAARLQASAEPGTIVVGDAVANRLTHGFALTSLGKLKVKGRKEAVEAWELLGPSGSGTGAPPTPFVGRDRELDRGTRVMNDLEAGRGQILFVQGDTGIGKSRLLWELRNLAGRQVTWLEGRCRSFSGDIAGWPFVELLQGWLGVIDDEPPMMIRTKLRSKLDALLPDEADDLLPFFGRLLSVGVDPIFDRTLESLSPAELVERTHEAYAAWISAIASHGPLVIAIEDVHDADPSTRSLAEALLPITDEAPVMLVLTARAEAGSEGWRLGQRVLSEFRHRATELQLEPLLDEAAGFLADALAPTGTLDAATKADIVARAAGNPLYLEELVRTLVDSGELDRQKNWTLTASSVMLLPPALESLLVARIQHLAPVVRALAQAASVIGQDVPAPLLEQVASAVDVHAGMGTLLRSEILLERMRYPELVYAFRHPLLREAALSTLTPARARELYGRVGAAFEAREGVVEGERLERLAYYFYRSDDKAKALEYLERAGGAAIEFGATQQATELLTRAAKVASGLGNGEAEARIGALLAGVGRVEQ